MTTQDQHSPVFGSGGLLEGAEQRLPFVAERRRRARARIEQAEAARGEIGIDGAVGQSRQNGMVELTDEVFERAHGTGAATSSIDHDRRPVWLLRIGFSSTSLVRKRLVLFMSNAEGSNGTSTTSARRNSSSTCFRVMAAGASMTRRCTRAGTSPVALRQSRPMIGAADTGRAASHSVALFWRSTSANTIGCPPTAKAVARLVAIVVLPHPPLMLVTSTASIGPTPVGARMAGSS